MNKPLLLGEAPSRALADQYHRPLSGTTAVKLLNLYEDGSNYDLGLSYERLTQLFACRNAIERYEDAYPWTADVARAAHERWVHFLCEWASDPINDGERLVVVCLGRNAQLAAFPRSRPVWGQWVDSDRVSYATIPHPSGLNRLYNTRDMRTVAYVTLREAVRRARSGD